MWFSGEIHVHPFRSLTALAALSFGITVGLRAQDDSRAYLTQPDIIYARKHGVALTMNRFRPVGEPNGAVILAIVSGGWFSSAKNAGSVPMEFLRRGYTVFAVVHGSQPKYTVAEIRWDIDQAVRYVRLHAAEWGVDPQRIGIHGSSAGCHLSLLQGMAGTEGDPAAEDPLQRTSSRIQAVACFYGPTDFLNYGAKGKPADGRGDLRDYFAAFDFHEYDEKTKRFLPVKDRGRREEIGRGISPATHVSSDDPPTLLIHGAEDKLVPLQQSELLIGKLTAAQVEARLLVKPGEAHGWKDRSTDYAAMADWFDRHLGADALTKDE